MTKHITMYRNDSNKKAIFLNQYQIQKQRYKKKSVHRPAVTNKGSAQIYTVLRMIKPQSAVTFRKTLYKRPFKGFWQPNILKDVYISSIGQNNVLEATVDGT